MDTVVVKRKIPDSVPVRNGALVTQPADRHFIKYRNISNTLLEEN
jgi:hypothetical protein